MSSSLIHITAYHRTSFHSGRTFHCLYKPQFLYYVDEQQGDCFNFVAMVNKESMVTRVDADIYLIKDYFQIVWRNPTTNNKPSNWKLRKRTWDISSKKGCPNGPKEYKMMLSSVSLLWTFCHVFRNPVCITWEMQVKTTMRSHIYSDDRYKMA